MRTTKTLTRGKLEQHPLFGTALVMAYFSRRTFTGQSQILAKSEDSTFFIKNEGGYIIACQINLNAAGFATVDQHSEWVTSLRFIQRGWDSENQPLVDLQWRVMNRYAEPTRRCVAAFLTEAGAGI